VALTLAVDIGGTFTDLLGYDDRTGRFLSAKSSTTPDDLAAGIFDCVHKIGVAPSDVQAFVHGSTVAINTVIERKGARTALVVTRGTRDVYAIGRGNRPDAYDVWFRRPRPLVPRHLTFEVDERLGPDGSVRIAFDEMQAADVAALVAREAIDAVAVCFLHSWNNPAHEDKMGALLRLAAPAAFVTLSHEILREYGEYERTSTSVLNSYIGPRVSAYLDGLTGRLHASGFDGDVLIMQSNGGVMTPTVAKAMPVATLESGPVGGFIAAARVGASLGCRQVIAFDMGGTTAKTSLVRDGAPQMAHGYHIGGYASGLPMTLPVVDTVEVGAGGGSLARANEFGGLDVGPESAGAKPGPACYGQGGIEPTVTDANLVLGRIDAHGFLGGEMVLDVEAARAAIRRVGAPLGLSEPAAAIAIVDVAVLKMSLAVRQVSVERGFDPRDFSMIAFGGAGPLHAADVARTLHIPEIVIPNFPGQFSAAGMLLADLRHDYVRTFHAPLERADFSELCRIADELSAVARRRLRDEGAADESMALALSLEVRYAGQDASMPVSIDSAVLERADRSAVHKAFNELHERAFAYHDADRPLEMVNVRLAASAKRSTPPLSQRRPVASESAASGRRSVWFRADSPIDCPIYERERLAAGTMLDGPAVVQEYASTTLIFPGDRLEVAATGELLIHLGAA
jgi:N-methylhydantoinase A